MTNHIPTLVGITMNPEIEFEHQGVRIYQDGITKEWYVRAVFATGPMPVAVEELAKAKARTIEAAPQLLEALEDIFSLADDMAAEMEESWPGDTEANESRNATVEKARGVIAKVTGGQS